MDASLSPLGRKKEKKEKGMRKGNESGYRSGPALSEGRQADKWRRIREWYRPP
jgi:hypothetical protein